MKIISHRGNLNGPNSCIENSQNSIQMALKNDFDVEIDIWFHNNDFYLGHDSPKFKIEIADFFSDKLWLHAKNLPALDELQKRGLPNYFYHQNDDCTIVSNGMLWLFPGKFIQNSNSIFVLPELSKQNIKNFSCFGICTDYPKKFLSILSN